MSIECALIELNLIDMADGAMQDDDDNNNISSDSIK